MKESVCKMNLVLYKLYGVYIKYVYFLVFVLYCFYFRVYEEILVCFLYDLGLLGF